MRKATFDMDATETIRRSAEATASTLAIYSALREIATEAGSCDFETREVDISSRALASGRSTRSALNFLERRRIIERRRTGRGLRVRMLKVAKC